jgi:osmoprotectant transport system ATP-binding protein
VKLRRSIGYVMQNGGLLPHRSVLDNIATVPLFNGVGKAAAHSRARELMDAGRDSTTNWPALPRQLSGGQQQRVGVARGLAADPNILLMDEPFGAVDPLVRAELQDELLRIQHTLAKTIVFVTHDVEEALRLGDQIILLAEGATSPSAAPVPSCWAPRPARSSPTSSAWIAAPGHCSTVTASWSTRSGARPAS